MARCANGTRKTCKTVCFPPCKSKVASTRPLSKRNSSKVLKPKRRIVPQMVSSSTKGNMSITSPDNIPKTRQMGDGQRNFYKKMPKTLYTRYVKNFTPAMERRALRMYGMAGKKKKSKKK